MNCQKSKIIICLIVLMSSFLTMGFTEKKYKPQTVYRIYLKGKSLGIIKSKKQLEAYIDKKQSEIKKKYNVDKVYVPSELDIVKEITYSNEITSVEKIYNKLKDISPFTISGYEITIRGVDKKDTDGKTIKGKSQKIYCLDKKVFTQAVESTVKSFISPDEYDAFANKTQKKIEDTGKIIENIYIQNVITIKKQKIPINKKIYETKEELSKYLLFGTLDEQQSYTVTDNDTIADIAFNNKISTEEFLIANPTIADSKSLLYTGQVVKLGIIKPQFNVVENDHIVFREEKNYTTETQYDNSKYVGYSETIQAGVKGEDKVTQKIQKINGETTNVATVERTTIKEPINEIIVKGGKKANYTGGGYGVAIATRGEWGWPATCSSISSPFGYRWGVLHDGTDIAGCGYGSNVFAAQSGTVVVSATSRGYYPGGYGTNGEYIIIDHHNGYYTQYNHLCPGCRYVKVGDNVTKGQVIAGMGNTGYATGVHLHFGVWRGYPYRGGVAFNAMSLY